MKPKDNRLEEVQLILQLITEELKIVSTVEEIMKKVSAGDLGVVYDLEILLEYVKQFECFANRILRHPSFVCLEQDTLIPSLQPVCQEKLEEVLQTVNLTVLAVKSLTDKKLLALN